MGYSKHELSTINMFSTPPKNCYITPLSSHSGNLSTTGAFFCPQSGLCEEVRLHLFRERLSEKLCTRQSRKVSWDMINTQFLAMQLSNPLWLLSFSTRKHMSMASRAILSNFFEKQWTKNHPQYPSGLSRALFPTMTFLEIAVYYAKLFLTPFSTLTSNISSVEFV